MQGYWILAWGREAILLWNMFQVVLLNPLINLVIMIVGFALFLFVMGTRRVRLREITQVREPLKETMTEGWDFVRGVPAFRFLAISIVALLVCDAVVEFHFMVVSYGVFPDASRYQTFYALYRLVLTVGSILIQGLLTSRIISTLSIKNAFFIKPISTLIGSIWMFVQATLVGALGGVMLLRLSQYTIDEPTRKAFQSLVPEERRGRVSIFIESYLYFAGTILGVLITGGIVIGGLLSGYPGYYRLYLGVSIFAALLAIWAISRMRRVYDSSLLNWRLKRRQRGRSVLEDIDF